MTFCVEITAFTSDTTETLRERYIGQNSFLDGFSTREGGPDRRGPYRGAEVDLLRVLRPRENFSGGIIPFFLPTESNACYRALYVEFPSVKDVRVYNRTGVTSPVMDKIVSLYLPHERRETNDEAEMTRIMSRIL